MVKYLLDHGAFLERDSIDAARCLYGALTLGIRKELERRGFTKLEEKEDLYIDNLANLANIPGDVILVAGMAGSGVCMYCKVFCCTLAHYDDAVGFKCSFSPAGANILLCIVGVMLFGTLVRHVMIFIACFSSKLRYKPTRGGSGWGEGHECLYI